MNATTALEVPTEVRAHPDAGLRLMGGVTERENLEGYLTSGGYAPVEDIERFVEAIDESGLRGRGGAAFPTGRKIRAVRAGRGVPVVVANGEEGEPASVKDRWLLRTRPHLVLDGLRLSALAVGAQDVVVYVSDPASAESVERAIEELVGHAAWSVAARIVKVDPTYVAGEETAAVQAINGGPALPMDKPPRPFEAGVGGRPTLICNVETLANLPFIQALGAQRYREVGTPASPGTFLLTLSGIDRPGLHEVPFGITLREVLDWLGEGLAGVSGALMGGYFSGIADEGVLSVPLDYDSLRDFGSGLGCGAIAIMRPGCCPVDVSAGVMAYFARANAAQCGSCFNGTSAMAGVLQALRNYQATDQEVQRLRDWSVSLRGRGACGTLDGATNLAGSLLSRFPAVVSAHVDGRCPVCETGHSVSDPPFVVPAAG